MTRLWLSGVGAWPPAQSGAFHAAGKMRRGHRHRVGAFHAAGKVGGKRWAWPTWEAGGVISQVGHAVEQGPDCLGGKQSNAHIPTPG